MFRSLILLVFAAVLPWAARGELTPITQLNIKTAVIEWAIDSDYADAKYGPIGTWDTSNIINMGYLFFEGRCPEGPTKETCRHNLINFNEDISAWDVSKVRIFTAMFWY